MREIVRALCCLPVAVSPLRCVTSGLVTCSDASMTGAGLCTSAGLAAESTAVLSNLEGSDVPASRSTGALRYNSCVGPRVLAVSLFDGIGALVCALSRLPCQVVGYASVEIDRACKAHDSPPLAWHC